MLGKFWKIMFTYVYLGLFQNVPNIFASNPGPGDPGFRLTVVTAIPMVPQDPTNAVNWYDYD